MMGRISRRVTMMSPRRKARSYAGCAKCSAGIRRNTRWPSADDARALALHHRLDFLDVDHRGVARRRHRESAMRRAVFDGGLGALAFHEAVREARRKAVPATDAIV